MSIHRTPAATGRSWAHGTRKLIRCFAALFALAVLLVDAQAQDGAETAAPAPVGSFPTSSIPIGSIPAARAAENVAIITIRGGIDMYTELSVKRRLDAAEQSGADAVVFEIDSPGGEVGAVLEICNRIKSSSIRNTVAWINDEAYSGGAIIALACREIVTSDPASMGDALPIQIGPAGLAALPEAERQKITAPLVAEVVDSARRNGYDEYLVQGMVALGVELWLVEEIATGRRMTVTEAEYRILFDGDPPRTGALLPNAPAGASPATPADESVDESGEADGSEPVTLPAAPIASEGSEYRPASPALDAMAQEVNDTLEEASTRPVITPSLRGDYRLISYATDGVGPVVMKHADMTRFGFSSGTIENDEQLTAFFGATNVKRLDRTWSESLVRFMTSLPVRGILIVVFLLALFMEMTNPGVMLPGGVAALALIALLAPSFMVGLAGWWEIAAIVIGIALIAAEIFVLPGFGVFGILGLLGLFGGLVGTFVRDDPSRLFPTSGGAQRDLIYGLTTTILALITSGVGMYFISKNFGSLPLVNKLILRDQMGDESIGMLAAAGPASSGPASVGETGTAVTPLRPSGRMRVGDAVTGRDVDVVAVDGWIEAGAPVRVIEVSGFRVAVEPVHGGEGQRDHRGPQGGDEA
ncbi:MAG: NfeD family protein [Planctomycetota bacterium]